MKNRTVWWYVYNVFGERIEWTKARTKEGAARQLNMGKPGEVEKHGSTVRRVTVEWEE